MIMFPNHENCPSKDNIEAKSILFKLRFHVQRENSKGKVLGNVRQDSNSKNQTGN